MSFKRWCGEESHFFPNGNGDPQQRTEEQMLLPWKLRGFTAPGATTATRGCCDIYLEWIPSTPDPILPNKYGLSFVLFSTEFVASTMNSCSSQQLWEPMSSDTVHFCQSLSFNLSYFCKIHNNGAAVLPWRLAQTIQSSLPVCNIKISRALIFHNIKQKFYSQLSELNQEENLYFTRKRTQLRKIQQLTAVTLQ